LPRGLDRSYVFRETEAGRELRGLLRQDDHVCCYPVGPAQAIDSNVTARTFPVIEPERDDEDAVFKYIDTASSRAGIDLVAKKLALKRVAIVGLGGTGSYVLDLVAKTLVKEIHLFDGDTFFQHNAFRSPGAPAGEELRAKPNKAAYFRDMYSKMRLGIHRSRSVRRYRQY